MVGNDAQGDILLVVLAVVHAHDLRNMLHDILDGIDQKQVVYALHDASQTLQTHTRVDVLLRHLGIVAFAV